MMILDRVPIIDRLERKINRLDKEILAAYSHEEKAKAAQKLEEEKQLLDAVRIIPKKELLEYKRRIRHVDRESVAKYFNIAESAVNKLAKEYGIGRFPAKYQLCESGRKSTDFDTRLEKVSSKRSGNQAQSIEVYRVRIIEEIKKEIRNLKKELLETCDEQECRWLKRQITYKGSLINAVRKVRKDAVVDFQKQYPQCDYKTAAKYFEISYKIINSLMTAYGLDKFRKKPMKGAPLVNHQKLFKKENQQSKNQKIENELAITYWQGVEDANYSVWMDGSYVNNGTKGVYSRKNIQKLSDRKRKQKLDEVLNTPISQVAYDEMERQLDDLRDIDRFRAKEMLEKADSKFEIMEAKLERDRIEKKIADLKLKLSVCTIIEHKSNHTISLGSHFKVKYLDDDEILQLQLVGPIESELSDKTISTTSPLGKAIEGKQCGDVFSYESPGGKVRVKVEAILRQ